MSGLFLLILSVVLAGYAILGRGFAYLGLPPVFVGELTMLLGLLVALRSRRLGNVLRHRNGLPLLLLLVWCFARTVPYLSEFGVDALRDGALWGYGLFAFLVAAPLWGRDDRLMALVHRYQMFVPLFLLSAPVVWMLGQYQLVSIVVPGTDIPLFTQRPGDLLVHLAGIIAFGLLRVGRVSAASWALAAGLFLLLGASNRAGLLSVMVGISTVVALKPMSRRLWRVASGFTLAVTLFLVVNPTIPTGRIERQISRDQLIASVMSIFTDDVEAGDLQGTKVWRLAWWATIIDYTVLGEYFWQGKGFGINLADDDGFQVVEDGPPLRSPHNGHMTFLARAGVPGFALWVLTQIAWAIAMFWAARRARALGDTHREAFLIFILAYWAAMMTNTTFDVYLEGPMGGIWFWSVFGIGLAALHGARVAEAEHREEPSVGVPAPT